MGKFAPSDILRKLDERCRLQLQEIDACEENLGASVKIYNQIRHEFILELTNSIAKLEDVESVRLQLFFDGLSRFCLACQGMMDHLEGLINEQINQFAFLDHEGELETLRLERSASGPEGSVPSKLSEQDQLGHALAVVSKISDAMETIRVLVQRFTTAMVEIAESGKHFSKVCHRIVDKQHGVNVKTSALSDTAAMLRGGSGNQLPSFGVLLSALEAPQTKKGWEAAISAVAKFAEAMQTSSEVIVEKCCVNADTLQRRIESSRKELNDVVSMNTKRIDALQTNATRATARLKKVKAELKDLRENGAVVSNKAPTFAPALSLPEHVDSRPSEDNSSPVASPRESENLEVSSVTSGETTVSSVVDLSTSASTATESQQSESQLTSPPAKRSSAVRLPSIPFQSLDPLRIGSALGAAVGLESASDRKVNRIAYLEDEEKSLVDAEAMAILALSNARESSLTEISNAIEAAKQSLGRDLLNMKMIMQILMDCQRLSQEISQSAVLKIRIAHETVNVHSELDYFLNFVRSTTEGIVNGVSTYSLDHGASGGTKSSFATYDVPGEESFSPTQNPVVNRERLLRAAAKVQAGDSTNSHPSEEKSKTVEKVNSEASEDEAVGQLDRISSKDLNDAPDGSPVIAPIVESDKVPPKIALPSPGAIKPAIETPPPLAGAIEPAIETPSPLVVANKATLETPLSAEKMAINARISEVMSSYNSSVTSGVASPSSELEITSLTSEKRGKFAVGETTKESSTLSDAPTTSLVSSPGLAEAPASPDQVKYTPSQYPREEAYVPPPDAGTGETEKVIESFSCAIYPKKGMLTHGRYVSKSKFIILFTAPH